MALPPLRQPKFFTLTENRSKKNDNNNASPKSSAKNEIKQIIVTLKNNAKLVVHSDAYHGILSAGDKLNCVFCDVELRTEDKGKELHKVSNYHKKTMDAAPFIEEYMTNLVRQINPESFYCTTCNVIVQKHFIIRHLVSEVHRLELDKARNKSVYYKAV